MSSALAQAVAEYPYGIEDRVARMVPGRMIRPPLLGINNAGIIDLDMSAATPTSSFTAIDIRRRVLYNPIGALR